MRQGGAGPRTKRRGPRREPAGEPRTDTEKPLTTLLARPDFRRFWVGQSVSQVGDGVHRLAVLWLSYAWTQSGMAVGGVMIASTLPGVLLGPVAGSVADRFDRRTVLGVANLLRALSTGWLSYRAWAGALALPELIAVTAVMSAAAAFFNPAALALLPNLVPPQDLDRANALTQIGSSACSTAGPLLGTGLIAALGPPLAFGANVATFLGSAACMGSLRAVPAPHAARAPFFQDMREGWRIALAVPLVRKLLGPVLILNFFFASLIVLIPILGEGIHGAGHSGVGFLLSSYAAGMLVAGILMATVRTGGHRGALVAWGIVVMGFAFAGTGLAPGIILAMACLVVVGITLTTVNVSLNTLFQEMFADEVRGKVFGLLLTLPLSLQPVAYGIVGALVDFTGPRPLLLGSGVVIALCGLLLTRAAELRGV